jgi:hypothetical protein
MTRVRSLPPTLYAAAVLLSAILCVHLTGAAAAAAAPDAPPYDTYLPLVVKTSAPPPSGVVVLSSNAFVPFSGSTDVYIVGEVQNNTASNVRFVKISAVFRDAGGQTVGTDYSYALAEAMTPGALSPFRIIFDKAPAWSTYDLTVTYSTTTAGWYVLELLNTETYYDSLDAFHVRGKVKNQYPVQKKSVTLFLTLYDSSGRVIGVDWGYLSPSTIDPGAEVSFDVDCYFWMGKPQHSLVAHYAIVADGE